jgi:hypothetical protein
MAYRDAAKVKAAARIIVGVDFGTTYSGNRWRRGNIGCADRPGIAFVTSTKGLKDVEVIQKWPGGLNTIPQKVPSLIAYAEENDDIGEDRWGSDVDGGLLSCSWFKLRLDKNIQKTEFDDPLLENVVGKGLMRLKPGKDAKEVTTDFLRLLFDYIMSQMQKAIGKTPRSRRPFASTSPYQPCGLSKPENRHWSRLEMPSSPAERVMRSSSQKNLKQPSCGLSNRHRTLL